MSASWTAPQAWWTWGGSSRAPPFEAPPSSRSSMRACSAWSVRRPRSRRLAHGSRSRSRRHVRRHPRLRRVDPRVVRDPLQPQPQQAAAPPDRVAPDPLPAQKPPPSATRPTERNVRRRSRPGAVTAAQAEPSGALRRAAPPTTKHPGRPRDPSEARGSPLPPNHPPSIDPPSPGPAYAPRRRGRSRRHRPPARTPITSRRPASQASRSLRPTARSRRRAPRSRCPAPPREAR